MATELIRVPGTPSNRPQIAIWIALSMNIMCAQQLILIKYFARFMWYPKNVLFLRPHTTPKHERYRRKPVNTWRASRCDAGEEWIRLNESRKRRMKLKTNLRRYKKKA